MLARLSSQLQRFSSTRNLLLFLALFVLFEAVILPVAGARLEALSGGVGPIDLNLYNTPTGVQSMVAAYGSDGRLLYLILQLTADVVFPIVYSLFLALTLTRFLVRGFSAGHPAQYLAFVPLLGALCDYGENLGIIVSLLIYPQELFIAALLPTLFTPLKWLMFAVSLVSLIVAVVAVLQRRRSPARA